MSSSGGLSRRAPASRKSNSHLETRFPSGCCLHPAGESPLSVRDHLVHIAEETSCPHVSPPGVVYEKNEEFFFCFSRESQWSLHTLKLDERFDRRRPLRKAWFGRTLHRVLEELRDAFCHWD